MGAYYSHALNPIRGAYTEHEVTPVTNSKPTFDPQLGFEYQRKPLEKKWTDEEMEAIRAPPNKRDYCAHLMIPMAKCRKENFPFIYKCKPEVHDYHHCQDEMQHLRVMEWERERRLRIRQKKINEAAQMEES